MACLYKRSQSPFWWIKYRDLIGKERRESTKLRYQLPSENRQARELCAEKSLEEARAGRITDKECWSSWVPQFIADRYRNSPKTLIAQSNRWRQLEKFLNENELLYPRQVTFEHCLEYLKWRTRQPEKGFHRASRNTAIYELKALGLFFKHALKLGYTQINPCASMGLKKDPPKLKPEITEKERSKIREALSKPFPWPELEKHRDWMSVSFEISDYQGCRLRETCLPLSDVDLKRQTIAFNAKGKKRFTTRLHPSLIPLFKKLQSEGRKKTCEMLEPASKPWYVFFRKMRMKHLCFHCTRVTVITRLARSGVPEPMARRYVGHASALIHHIYQRLSVDDLSLCVDALNSSQQTCEAAPPHSDKASQADRQQQNLDLPASSPTPP